jgi:2-oxoglutarate dehydrogenase E1 component
MQKHWRREMEQQFLKELQDRLDEVKQHPLPYTYQKPEIVVAEPAQGNRMIFNSSPM